MIQFSQAKEASKILRTLPTSEKNSALIAVSTAIKNNYEKVLSANAIDVKNQLDSGAKSSFIDRLTLTKERIFDFCDDMIKVANLSDPVGEVLQSWTAPSGIIINKVAVPFGVIGVIYEARPNVTADVFSLCLKTGNACLLKGGKDAHNTNSILVDIIRSALSTTNVPMDAVILLPSSRESTTELISARGFVDLIIPRGSKSLIDYVVSNSRVPVIETGAGVCHTFVAESADLDMAFDIVKNAKTSRPSVCNALETLLVHKSIAEKLISRIKADIPNLVLRGDDSASKLLDVLSLGELGYNTEYGDLQLSIKIVDDVFQAVEHINRFGTHHSDCIVSSNTDEAKFFLDNVDSACVYHNASTRFSDGGCFGFGAELGISTQKLHARGPMALREMTSYQYKILGNGQVR